MVLTNRVSCLSWRFDICLFVRSGVRWGGGGGEGGGASHLCTSAFPGGHLLLLFSLLGFNVFFFSFLRGGWVGGGITT